MGCFLGCFGFSGKRRRRKPTNKVLPGDHRHGSYEPLDSSVCVNLDIAENPTSSDSKLSNKIKEKSSNKIRKKVSFNLNVQAYEPLTNEEITYHLSESDDEEREEKKGEKVAKESLYIVCEGDSTATKTNVFPTNHRYQNCKDSYDYEDDLAYVESDLEDEDGDEEYDDDEDDYDENDFDDQRISQKSAELPERLSVIHLDVNKINNHMQLPAASTQSIESKGYARDRSQYLNSVLNPVENLTQWKAVKARTAAPKNPRKENVALQQEPTIPFGLKTGSNLYPFSLVLNHKQSKPLVQEIAVDASLSKWLASPNSNEYKTRNITNSNSISVEPISLKRSMFDRSCSRKSKEDRSILDITYLKA